jgi:hypothetical protein
VVHWKPTLVVLGVPIPQSEKLPYRKTNTAQISLRKYIYDSDYISLIYIVHGTHAAKFNHMDSVLTRKR